jgi:hypothetical protein
VLKYLRLYGLGYVAGVVHLKDQSAIAPVAAKGYCIFGFAGLQGILYHVGDYPAQDGFICVQYFLYSLGTYYYFFTIGHGVVGKKYLPAHEWKRRYGNQQLQ